MFMMRFDECFCLRRTVGTKSYSPGFHAPDNIEYLLMFAENSWPKELFSRLP